MIILLVRVEEPVVAQVAEWCAVASSPSPPADVAAEVVQVLPASAPTGVDMQVKFIFTLPISAMGWCARLWAVFRTPSPKTHFPRF